MKTFFQRVFNTEFLPMSEVRKIKVLIVMVFLLVTTLSTVPFSLVLDYSLAFKIGAIAVLFVSYLVILLLLRFGRYVIASQLSIVYMFLITVFYTQGSSSFFAYLFFYILLMIVIFYQELYLFVFYGTLTLGFGISYVLLNQADFALLGGQQETIFLLIATLGLFYLIFLIQILHSEKLYTDLNLDWVKMNQIIDQYQGHSLHYLAELRKKQKESPLYENVVFQQAANEIAVFIAQQVREHGKDILNIMDLYLYIHERGLSHILDNDDFSIPMKRMASRLEKYLLNKKSDMVSMIFNFQTIYQATEPYHPRRYAYKISEIAPSREDQIIALAFLYAFLANEPTQLDQYDQMTKVLSKTEIEALFTSSEAEQILDYELVAFFKANKDLFEEYLHGLKRKE